MKELSVIGHLGFGENLLNGQTVKTKIITNELCRVYGQSEVLQFDTHGGKKTLLKAPFYVWKTLQKSKNVIIMPAHNGLRVFGRLLPIFRRFFKNRKIHYVVIGGWLPQMLESKKSLAKELKKFDGIYVETNTMKNALEAQGFQNVVVMPNCKKLHILSEDELVYQISEPYKVCTFSRVTKEKGIEDAINAIKAVNEKFGRTVYELDIYGQVDAGQTEWFETVKKTFPPFVKYQGIVPFDQSVEVLKNYFALLFPTHFFTEGIPGTVIDAYAAGVPVISSMWESFADVIDDQITGIGYTFGSVNELTDLLSRISEKPQMILDLKKACITKAEKFTPEKVIGILLRDDIRID